MGFFLFFCYCDIYFCMFCYNEFCDLTTLNQNNQPNYATFVTVNIRIFNCLTAIKKKRQAPLMWLQLYSLAHAH